MKKIFYSIMLVTVCLGACKSSNSHQQQLKGEWRSKDGETILKITNKEFIMDNGTAIPEDYFLSGDTILTSFEGNYPYTPFIITKLTDKELTLFYPDSIEVEFVR